MRLWHVDLLSALPKPQLVAQWRELNSIYKKQDKHILINYIYNYDKTYLYEYSLCVIYELLNRHIKIRSYKNFNFYFSDLPAEFIRNDKLKYLEHDNEYLKICYWNLREKFMRGQKDFTEEDFKKIEEIMVEKEK